MNILRRFRAPWVFCDLRSTRTSSRNDIERHISCINQCILTVRTIPRAETEYLHLAGHEIAPIESRKTLPPRPSPKPILHEPNIPRRTGNNPKRPPPRPTNLHSDIRGRNPALHKLNKLPNQRPSRALRDITTEIQTNDRLFRLRKDNRLSCLTRSRLTQEIQILL